MMENSLNRGEIVIYQPDEVTRLEVRVEGETVWLNRHQLASLFGREVKTIGKHIKNALREELRSLSTVANFATVQKEGDRLVERNVEYYNLDMIISIGYRVKSERGVLFRSWANAILKEYLVRGYVTNRRIDVIEESTLPPVEGIFYDGQIFDAYVFVSDLVKSARRRIILIVDDVVYHIGASLKDLGKKLFAFSKMCLSPDMLL